MIVALGLLAVLALILANGYFVAAEFAFVAARRPRLEELANEGNRRAKRALGVLKRLSFMLSGAQLGITVTSLAVGFVAEDTLARALLPVVEFAGVPPQAAFGLALSIGFVVATMAQMVLGELGPKNLAIARPEPIAMALAGSTALYTRLASPVIRLFDSSANRLLRAVGIEPVEELAGGASAEELGYIIEDAAERGHLTADQTTLLTRVLEFRQLRAVDAMVPHNQVVSLPATATCDDLRALAIASGHSRFPLVGDGLDDVHGVVLAKDVLSVPVAERAATPAGTLASPPLAVPESALLPDLLTQMRDAQDQLAVVVDEYGGTAGIVTLEDIVEEIVGDIEDEFDEAEPHAHRRPDGTFTVPGAFRLDEVERETAIALPEGDYETVGGLIMAALGRIPKEGDAVEVPGALLQVEQRSGLAVGLVRIVPQQPHGEGVEGSA